MNKQNENLIKFHYKLVNNNLEEQANMQGYTLGEKGMWLEKHYNEIYRLWIDNLLTNREMEKLMERLNKKTLKLIQRIGENENDKL